MLRRQQLEGLLQRGLVMSEQMAAKCAFRGWHQVRALAVPCTTDLQPEQVLDACSATVDYTNCVRLKRSQGHMCHLEVSHFFLRVPAVFCRGLSAEV